VHKRTEATVKGGDGKQFFVSKGAPQVILQMSKNADAVKPEVEKAVNEFAGRGFRSLGVCRADQEGNWQFAGVIPMFDPPREQAKATIASARQMGLNVKMVTGDQTAIARETSKQLGLGTNIVDASTLGDTKQQPGPKIIDAIEKADGFAEVFPEHKYFIIEALQKSGHIVGMTGDGVNDAPALKKADCGIAVSGATDAARAAASIVLLAPGLSVIIEAIKESRKIFQRMNSYAMYRIAETLRVVLFMTVAILVFNFYPVTAVMIVMIALLNDGAILSIAYDNVRYSNKPEAWNMRRVLGVSTVLGVNGVIAAFLLFWLGERVFHLDRAHVQTLMYLKLSVAGHLTIFLTRTRGPFWTIKPAKILWIAVLGTQIIATLIAVYGLFMTPLGWKFAGLVWGYAILWALFTDRIKLLAYRVLDHVKADEAKPEAKADAAKPEDKADAAKPEAKADEPKPEAKADEPKPEDKADQPKPEDKADEAKPEAKAEPKPEDKAEQPKPEAKADDAKPEAKADVAKPEDKAEDAKPEAKADDAKPEAKADQPKPEAKAEPKPDAKADDAKPEDKADQTKPEAKADDAKPEDKAEPKPEDKADDAKPEDKDKEQSDITPQLVKRVHELYEELGREDVQTVQDWEKANPATGKTKSQK
jgi:H+-transporting ATPase